MKKSLVYIILAMITIISCDKEPLKTPFIGKWSSTSNYVNKINLEFFNDSLIMDNSLMNYTTSDLWKIDSSKIYIKLIRGDEEILGKYDTIDYKFSPKKDTLFWKTKSDSIFNLNFVKIQNGYEYFENSINLKIDLQLKKDNLITAGDNKYGLNIYLTYKNGKLIARTDFNYNLNQIKLLTFSKAATLNKRELDELKFVLFIDKNVPENKIDSIINILKKVPVIKKTFRVYTNDKIDYKKTDWKDKINWYGVYEK